MPRKLVEVATPCNGIKTGLTAAFIATNDVAASLISASQKSASLLRPWLTGDELSKWHLENLSDSLIFIPKGWTYTKYGRLNEKEAWKAFVSGYPAIAARLASFQTKAKNRADKGDFWWELRACDYYDIFDRSFIAFPEMSQGPKFVMNHSGAVLNNKCFLLDSSDFGLLAYLNSSVCWFLLKGICSALRGGQWRLELRADYLQDLPIPDLFSDVNKSLSTFAQACTDASQTRFRIQSSVRHRILDLAPPEKRKLTGKLENWHKLSFTDFRAEVKKAFRAEIPVKERGEWEAYLKENAAEVHRLTAEIASAEREIDKIVYQLFDLTPEEIALLEVSLAGQY